MLKYCKHSFSSWLFCSKRSLLWMLIFDEFHIVSFDLCAYPFSKRSFRNSLIIRTVKRYIYFNKTFKLQQGWEVLIFVRFSSSYIQKWMWLVLITNDQKCLLISWLISDWLVNLAMNKLKSMKYHIYPASSVVQA